MAPKTGPSLRELIKNRNKAPSPQDKNKSKPPINHHPLPPFSFLLISGYSPTPI